MKVSVHRSGTGSFFPAELAKSGDHSTDSVWLSFGKNVPAPFLTCKRLHSDVQRRVPASEKALADRTEKRLEVPIRGVSQTALSAKASIKLPTPNTAGRKHNRPGRHLYLSYYSRLADGCHSQFRRFLSRIDRAKQWCWGSLWHGNDENAALCHNLHRGLIAVLANRQLRSRFGLGAVFYFCPAHTDPCVVRSHPVYTPKSGMRNEREHLATETSIAYRDIKVKCSYALFAWRNAKDFLRICAVAITLVHPAGNRSSE